MFAQFFKLKPDPKLDSLQVGSRSVPLLFVHHPRARRYLLRLRQDGVARVTVPRRGSVSAARDFVARNIGWLEQQIQRLAAQPKTVAEWKTGSEILFRGELVRIEVEMANQIRFGSELLSLRDVSVDLRPATRVEEVRSVRGVFAYASKYLAKVEDDPAPEYESIGRCWGIMGRAHLPWAEIVKMELSPEQGVRLRRAAVRYLKAGRKKKRRGKNRAPGLWWLSGSPAIWLKLSGCGQGCGCQAGGGGVMSPYITGGQRA